MATCDYLPVPTSISGGPVSHQQWPICNLASGAALTFTDKIAAVGQIVLDRLENGHLTSSVRGRHLRRPMLRWLPERSQPGTRSTPSLCPQLTAAVGQAASQPSRRSEFRMGPASQPAHFTIFVINGLTGATTLAVPFVNSSRLAPSISRSHR